MCKELYKCKFMIMIDETQIYILRTNENVFGFCFCSKRVNRTGILNSSIANGNEVAWPLRAWVGITMKVNNMFVSSDRASSDVAMCNLRKTISPNEHFRFSCRVTMNVRGESTVGKHTIYLYMCCSNSNVGNCCDFFAAASIGLLAI